MLGTGGRTVPMSFDHKPNNVFVCNVECILIRVWQTTEEKRIVEAGGLVSLKRVNGDLAVELPRVDTPLMTDDCRFQGLWATSHTSNAAICQQ